jgi:hypothetical protein
MGHLPKHCFKRKRIPPAKRSSENDLSELVDMARCSAIGHHRHSIQNAHSVFTYSYHRHTNIILAEITNTIVYFHTTKEIHLTIFQKSLAMEFAEWSPGDMAHPFSVQGTILFFRRPLSSTNNGSPNADFLAKTFNSTFFLFTSLAPRSFHRPLFLECLRIGAPVNVTPQYRERRCLLSESREEFF